MDYKGFRKTMMPVLNKKMADLGFETEKSKTPTYWKLPHEDKRLAWVVSFQFGRPSSTSFEVYLTPYWIPSHPTWEPFPHGVGYIGYLNDDHCNYDGQRWRIETCKEVGTATAEKSIEDALAMLQKQGFAWFEKFSTPQKLLKEHPIAHLAADLGEYEKAKELYRTRLSNSFHNLLFRRKMHHMTLYDSLREWEIRNHEATIEQYKVVLTNLGHSEAMCMSEMATYETELLTKEKAHCLKCIAHNPAERWSKSQVKYCDLRIAELKEVLVSPSD